MDLSNFHSLQTHVTSNSVSVGTVLMICDSITIPGTPTKLPFDKVGFSLFAHLYGCSTQGALDAIPLIVFSTSGHKAGAVSSADILVNNSQHTFVGGSSSYR